jgi:hypothetical protein
MCAPYTLLILIALISTGFALAAPIPADGAIAARFCGSGADSGCSGSGSTPPTSVEARVIESYNGGKSSTEPPPVKRSAVADESIKPAVYCGLGVESGYCGSGSTQPSPIEARAPMEWYDPKSTGTEQAPRVGARTPMEWYDPKSTGTEQPSVKRAIVADVPINTDVN